MANICVRYSQRGRNYKELLMGTTPANRVPLLRELIAACSELSNLTVEEANTAVFRSSESPRLSYFGFLAMRTQFPAYSFEISNPMKVKNLIALGKLSYPYYFTGKRLVVFSESDATMITLTGSVELFLENNV